VVGERRLLGKTVSGILLTLLLIGMSVLVHNIQPVKAGYELKTKIDEVFQPLIDSGERVGIVVGVINKGINYSRPQVFSYGETVLGSGIQPNRDTLFEIASLTKTFTTLLLADMVLNGTVNLEDPVENFLPESVNVPSKSGRKITLLDLATHTSGLPRMPTNWDPKDWENPYADYTAELLYEFLSSYTLPRMPGTAYEYSNVGMGLLGHALELKTGINYSALVLDRICNPLDMDDTRIHLSAEQEQRLAQGYELWENRLYSRKNWDWDVLAPCGALRSTVNDMLIYMSANLGLVETDLSSAIELTHTVSRYVSGRKICLGWHAFDLDGVEVLQHDGATYGYNSLICFIKEEGIGVVILSNTWGWNPKELSFWTPGLQILRVLREYTETTVHDVAVTEINPYRTVISNNTITTINVTAVNQGNATETFSVTLYYNNTNTVGTQTLDLPANQSTVLTFEWTTPTIPGNYTIKAIASLARWPGWFPGETEIEDNVLTCSVQISIQGDINADGTVNIIDISAAARAFGSKPGEDKWNSNADINEDGWINIIDISAIAREFGKKLEG